MIKDRIKIVNAVIFLMFSISKFLLRFEYTFLIELLWVDIRLICTPTSSINYNYKSRSHEHCIYSIIK